METGWRSEGERTRRLPLWEGDRTMDLFLPTRIERDRPPVTVVCLAGGGYGFRSWHEGPAIALWLAMHGFAAVDVPYTTARDVPDNQPLGLRPLRDACRAIRVVRDHADQFGLSPRRIAVLGFSAGGHLAGSTALLHAESDAGDDLADTWSGRPDAAALIYPVVSMVPPCHQGSVNNLYGSVGNRRQNVTEHHLRNAIRSAAGGDAIEVLRVHHGDVTGAEAAQQFVDVAVNAGGARDTRA